MYETQKTAVQNAQNALNAKLADCQIAGDHGVLTVHTPGGRKFDLSFAAPHHDQTQIDAAAADNTNLTIALGNLSGVGGTFTLSVVVLGGGSCAANTTFTN